MQNLTSHTAITKVHDAVAAGTTDVVGTSVDMRGYYGVLFLTSYGTAAANNLLHVEGSSAASSGFEDLTGSEAGAGASDEDQWLEIVRPVKRYLRPVGLRGTSSTLGDVWALRYGARDVPVDNTTAGTIHGELHLSPSTGTK